MTATKVQRPRTKGTTKMGRVTTKIVVENAGDEWAVKHGVIKANEVRRITIDDALVDTGAAFLTLPKKMVKALGLTKFGEKRFKTAAGERMAGMFDAVRLTIEGRTCTVDVMEAPNGVPVLIGQIPLEILDFVVDPKRQRIIGNPAHGGEWVIEAY